MFLRRRINFVTDSDPLQKDLCIVYYVNTILMYWFFLNSLQDLLGESMSFSVNWVVCAS